VVLAACSSAKITSPGHFPCSNWSGECPKSPGRAVQIGDCGQHHDAVVSRVGDRRKRRRLAAVEYFPLDHAGEKSIGGINPSRTLLVVTSVKSSVL